MRLPRTRGAAEAVLGGTTLIWGGTFVVIKTALAGVGPLQFVAMRFLIAAVVLALIYGRRLRREGILPGILAGTVLYAAFAAQTIGLLSTTPAKSAFVTGLSVPLVPLVGSVVYKSRPRWFELAGILVATSGMALMTLPSGKLEISQGDVWTLICAVAFALHIVVMGHFSPRTGFETMAVLQTVVAALLGSATALLAGGVRTDLSGNTLAAIAGAGFLATALAFTAMAWAQQYTTAARTAVILALEPVVAAILSWLATGEVLPLRGKIGAALILGGVLFIELKRAYATIEISGLRAASHEDRQHRS